MEKWKYIADALTDSIPIVYHLTATNKRKKKWFWIPIEKRIPNKTVYV